MLSTLQIYEYFFIYLHNILRNIKMSFKKIIKKAKSLKLTLEAKLILSLLSIAAILLVSSVISVLEYSSMSNYVSELIADDMSSIDVANQLSDMSNTYNLEILAAVGDGAPGTLPAFDNDYFKTHCGNLRMSNTINQSYHMADSVMYSYAAYMLTSLELPEVMESDFIDARTWFFDRLQPQYNRLRRDLNNLTAAIHDDLAKNSATFERGFYRSIIPGIVAVGVGLLLVLMLLFFMLSYYVKPLNRMLAGLNAYRISDKRYTVSFDGDDQLCELNDGINELANENQQLRRRIKNSKLQ